jgi:hypothetical protein
MHNGIKATYRTLIENPALKGIGKERVVEVGDG